MDQLAVELKEHAAESVAQPHGAPDDRVEDWLHIGLGPTDDAQDLSRRRLLLEGFGNLSMSLCKGEVLFLQLGKEAYVLDGDQRLIGECAKQLDLSLAELAWLTPADSDRADRAALTQHGHGQRRAKTTRHRCRLGTVLLVNQDIRDMGDRAVTNRPRRRRRAASTHGVRAANRLDSLRARAIYRDEVNRFTIEACDGARLSAAQPDGALGDDVEHWLDIRRGARDRPQDLARCRLLLEGLADLGVRLSERLILQLELGEEADVLDGDDRLVGEGLQQLDLAIRERPGLGARHHDDTDGRTFPPHWYEEAASIANRARHHLILVFRIDLHVGYVGNRAIQDCPARPAAPAGARREYAMRRLEGFGSVVVLGDQMEQLAVEPIERAEESVAQSHGTSDNRVEDRLHVGLRLADDAQDLRRRRLLLQRLGQVAVAGLQLPEQADVLDGDHGLIGECLEQGHLRIGEGAHLGAQDRQVAQRLPLAQQRDLRTAMDGVELEQLEGVRVLGLRHELHVVDDDSSPIQHRAPARELA